MKKIELNPTYQWREKSQKPSEDTIGKWYFRMFFRILLLTGMSDWALVFSCPSSSIPTLVTDNLQLRQTTSNNYEDNLQFSRQPPVIPIYPPDFVQLWNHTTSRFCSAVETLQYWNHFHYFDRISHLLFKFHTFIQIFTFLFKFHTFVQISQFCPNFTLLSQFHNVYQISHKISNIDQNTESTDDTDKTDNS